MDKEFIRKIIEKENEDIVTGIIAGKLAIPDKGYLIMVECSEVAFGLVRLDPMTCQEEFRTYKEAPCTRQA